jgi:hypothetical protein
MSQTMTDAAAVTGAKKRKIEFFYGAKAPDMEETTMMENRPSPIVEAGFSKMVEHGYASGYELKCLFRSPDPDGFSLTYVWFKGNFPLPPHSHNTDCLYYVISGELKMGNRVLRAGDGFLLPADAGYSYVPGPDGIELLEFRGSSQFDIKIGEGTAQFWDRLAGICESNRELWKKQRPPARVLPR